MTSPRTSMPHDDNPHDHSPHDGGPPAAGPHRPRAAWRPIAVAAIGASALITTGVGVVATLTASASNIEPQSVDSGTLALTLDDNGDGFAQSIGNMAPGDTVHRFVTLENTGSLDARDLTFTASATGAPALIADGKAPSTTKALRVGVTSCSTTWDPRTGKCTGTVTSLLAPTELATAATAQRLVDDSVAAGRTVELRIEITLPDQDEVTVNGVAPEQTVQGASVEIVHTFTATQRAATITDS